jgi:uncharacterized protein (TIGR02145 family)
MKDKLVIAIVILGMITACSKDDADSIDTNSETSNTTEIIDGDGNVYESVTIGNQVWLNKNMMSTTFMNGTSIPSTTPYNVNLGVTTKAGPTQWPVSYSESKVSTHGRLYTAAVAISNLKICPNGYRVPTVSDFEILSEYAGVGAIGLKVPNVFGGTCCGYTNYEGDNSLGFSAVPVGRRLWSGGLHQVDGFFDSVQYWTSTLHSSNNDADGDGVGDGIV